MLHRLSIVRGWPTTAATLRAWRARPFRSVAPWFALSLGIAFVLLVATCAVALLSPPDTTRPLRLPSESPRSEWRVFRYFVVSNSVVLALHAAACFSGFLVFLSITQPDPQEGQLLRRATRATAIGAIFLVPVATLLSIATQAWTLGSYASTAAYHDGVQVWALIVSTLPHALPELTAVFLPLAACLLLGRTADGRGRLLAATIVSVVIALPMIAVSGVVEARTWHGRAAKAVERHPSFTDVNLGWLHARDGSVTTLVARERMSSGRSWATASGARDEAKVVTRRDNEVVAVLRVGDRYQLWSAWAFGGFATTRVVPDDTSPPRIVSDADDLQLVSHGALRYVVWSDGALAPVSTTQM